MPVRKSLRTVGCPGRGFATFAAFVPVDPKITWAKLAAMADGARLASQELW